VVRSRSILENVRTLEIGVTVGVFPPFSPGGTGKRATTRLIRIA
jgi:hypothetical protein